LDFEAIEAKNTTQGLRARFLDFATSCPRLPPGGSVIVSRVVLLGMEWLVQECAISRAMFSKAKQGDSSLDGQVTSLSITNNLCLLRISCSMLLLKTTSKQYKQQSYRGGFFGFPAN